MRWTFAQIEGPSSDRKTLELEGWKAPFGRARQEPVIRELIKSRIQTTRYPGSNNQARHAFGTNWEPVDLKGRWMTKQGGLTAREMADAWTDFVRDERTIRISWGYIVSYTGYIEELELGREDEHNIAWRMHVHIDKRDDIRHAELLPTVDPTENYNAMFDSFIFSDGKAVIPEIPELEPTFLESLENLAAELNKPAAAFAKAIGEIDDFRKESFATLQAFRGTVSNMFTALAELHDFVVNTTVDEAILVRTAESDIAWVEYQLNLDNQVAILYDQLTTYDRLADQAQVDAQSKFVLAVDGDSWESISIRATGSADKAGAIRSLNGAQYGERPTPGESYLVQ